MSKKKKVAKTSNSNEIVPNTQAPEKQKVLTTMTEFYQHWYQTLFNKLPKEEQELLTANLTKGTQIVRGEVREFSNVRNFVRSVIEKAEEEYDKFVAKQKADAAKVKSKK